MRGIHSSTYAYVVMVSTRFTRQPCGIGAAVPEVVLEGSPPPSTGQHACRPAGWSSNSIVVLAAAERLSLASSPSSQSPSKLLSPHATVRTRAMAADSAPGTPDTDSMPTTLPGCDASQGGGGSGLQRRPGRRWVAAGTAADAAGEVSLGCHRRRRMGRWVGKV